jgi:anti-sigma B factor antagonist
MAMATVRLLEVPVELHRRSGEHQEALRRELDLIEHAQASDAAPARLHALTKEMIGRYGTFTEEPARRLQAAAAAGDLSIDIELRLPADVVDATLQLGTLLDELDAFCREGDLLTLVTPPVLRTYRRWVLGEIVGQIRDRRPPEPWRGPTRDAPEPVPGHDPPSTACVAVQDDLDLATSADLRRTLVGHIDDGVTDITIDLSACEFLDSTGLSLLVTTHRRLVERGGGLRIVGARDQVLGVLDLSGTTDYFGRG